MLRLKHSANKICCNESIRAESQHKHFMTVWELCGIRSFIDSASYLSFFQFVLENKQFFSRDQLNKYLTGLHKSWKIV